MQTQHSKLQTTANKLEIDDSQFEKANGKFSASQASLQNTVGALHTTNIKFRLLQANFRTVHTVLRTNNIISRIQTANYTLLY